MRLHVVYTAIMFYGIKLQLYGTNQFHVNAIQYIAYAEMITDADADADADAD